MMDGSVEAVVWEDTLDRTNGIWDPGKLVQLHGTVRERDGDLTISVQKAAELDVEKLMIREVKEGNKDLDREHYSTPRNEVIYTGKRSEVEDSSAHLNSGNNFQNNGSRKKLLLYLKESNE